MGKTWKEQPAKKADIAKKKAERGDIKIKKLRNCFRKDSWRDSEV